MAISHSTLAMLIAIWLHDSESEDRFPHASWCSSCALQRCFPSYAGHGHPLTLDDIIQIDLAGYRNARQQPQMGIASTVKPYRAAARVLPHYRGRRSDDSAARPKLRRPGSLRALRKAHLAYYQCSIHEPIEVAQC